MTKIYKSDHELNKLRKSEFISVMHNRKKKNSGLIIILSES
jgi:hypothetical protein